MRFKLKLNPRLRKPTRHRLTIICGEHRGPAGSTEVFRIDIPVEVQRDQYGQHLVIPDNAWRSYLDETKQFDYVDVAVRSQLGAL